MNINHITCLALACTLAAMTSCRENREEGYRSRTDTNDWIIATLREQYLWNETLNEGANRYAEPDIYFSNVLSRTGNGGRSDSYSFIDVSGDTGRLDSVTATYGLHYYTETTSGRDLAARVLAVADGSPAYIAGIRRGDWITGVNGIILTEQTLASLDRGGAATFTRATCAYDAGEETYVWTNTDTVAVAAARYADGRPFACDTTYDIGGHRIGYLKVNPGVSAGTYTGELARVLSAMSGCTDLIVDMRYCGDNDVRFVTDLAAGLLDEGMDDSPFLTLRHNDLHTDSDSTITLGDATGIHLGCSHIYAITDGDTGRTNESFIHGLMAYIDVTVIGQTSEGSNVVLGCFACPAYPQYVIYPVVAAYASADETADPSQRITPDLEADERTNEVTAYKALGDTAELMLSRAIDVVINGLPTDDEGGEPVTE